MSTRPTRPSLAALVAALLGFVLLALAPAARAADDIENSAATGWWTYSGMSFNDVGAHASQLNARLVNLKFDPASNTFSGAYVANTGAFAKSWWWYAGIDANALSADLAANNARLISLQAYVTGGGVRFAAVMVANTGADAKSWWWYYGKSANDVGAVINANHARLTSVSQYMFGGQTVYAVVMIANTGADAKAWWWYLGQTPDQITALINQHQARLIDVTSAGGGRFNAVMESCATGCPGWWWYFGLNNVDLLHAATTNHARISTMDMYPGCGSRCYVASLISDQ
jgi:hypothetical protein